MCNIPSKKIPHSKNLSYHDNNDKLLVLTWFHAQCICWQSAARTFRLTSTKEARVDCEELVAKQGCSLIPGMLTVVCLASPRHSSSQYGYIQTGSVTLRQWTEPMRQSRTILVWIFFNSLDTVCRLGVPVHQHPQVNFYVANGRQVYLQMVWLQKVSRGANFCRMQRCKTAKTRFIVKYK